MVKVMLGQVASARYMREPMASQYGTFHIAVMSAIKTGDLAADRLTCVSIGMDTSFRSSKPKCHRIASMYEHWDRWSIQVG